MNISSISLLVLESSAPPLFSDSFFPLPSRAIPVPFRRLTCSFLLSDCCLPPTSFAPRLSFPVSGPLSCVFPPVATFFFSRFSPLWGRFPSGPSRDSTLLGLKTPVDRPWPPLQAGLASLPSVSLLPPSSHKLVFLFPSTASVQEAQPLPVALAVVTQHSISFFFLLQQFLFPTPRDVSCHASFPRLRLSPPSIEGIRPPPMRRNKTWADLNLSPYPLPPPSWFTLPLPRAFETLDPHVPSTPQ